MRVITEVRCQPLPPPPLPPPPPPSSTLLSRLSAAFNRIPLRWRVMGAVQGIGAVVIISIMTHNRDRYRDHLTQQSPGVAQRRGGAATGLPSSSFFTTTAAAISSTSSSRAAAATVVLPVVE